MNFDELFEWTTGWAWPVMILLGVLIAWGIGRFLTWGEENERIEDRPAPTAGDGRECTCR